MGNTAPKSILTAQSLTRSKEQSIDLTKGSIRNHILRMLGPFSIAVITLISAGLVDAIYLGHLGVEFLAALGFCFPIVFLCNSVNIGLGAGTLAAVSQAIGKKAYEQARRHAACSVLLSILVLSVVSFSMIQVSPYLLRQMGALPHTADLAFGYILLVLPSLIVMCIAMACNNILRAHGEAVWPSLIVVSGALVNIILDPFLIFGWGFFPRLEMTGAAIATVVGNIFSAVFGLWMVMFSRHVLSLKNITFSSLRRAWLVIGRVGLPAIGTNIIVPLSSLLAVQIIAVELGPTEEVAAFTVVGRVEMFSIAVLYALSACIGAITGQNGGAGLTERVREAFVTCFQVCAVWGVICALVLYLFASPILGLFTRDKEVIAMALPYFSYVPLTIIGYGIVFVSAAGFNALGRPVYGLVFTILRSLVLYIPLVWIGVRMLGMNGAFIGIACANICAGLLTYFWVMKKAPMYSKIG